MLTLLNLPSYGFPCLLPLLSPAPPPITSLPPGTYLFCICLTLCTVSGGKSLKRTLLFLAESQGPERHQAQSGYSRSSSYDYALQTPAPSEASLAQTVPSSLLGEILPVPTGNSGAEGGNQRRPGEHTGSWAWARSNIRELKKNKQKKRSRSYCLNL